MQYRFVLSIIVVASLPCLVFAQQSGDLVDRQIQTAFPPPRESADTSPSPPAAPPTEPPFEAPPTSGQATANKAPAAQPPGDLPLATRKTDFYVPFKVPKNSSASELQLYVSSDLGLNWKLYGREEPTAGQFRFLAAHDGEYWYYLHTVYVGRTAKPGPFQPQLKVLVDTTSPRLEGDAKVDPQGNVRLTWKAYDPHLLADTLQFELYDSKTKQWRVLQDLQLDNTQQPNTQSLGSAIRTPAANAVVEQYRITIADRSGNTAVVEKSVTLPQAIAADPVGNDADTGDKPGVQTWRPIQSRDTPGSTPVPPTPLVNQNKTPADTIADNKPAVEPRESSATVQPVSSPVRPRVGSQAVAGTWKTPSGERPQMTNKRDFKLAYDVKSVGPSGLAKVSLWSTNDNGATWSLFSTDEDRQSPIDVTVADDGVYGFIIVLEAGNGLANAPPTAGDMADVWIGVDTAKPLGEITSAPYGTGDYAGHLTIQYQAEDALLADRPITLSFAERPEGPWTMIAAGLENTGEYQWRLDQRIPQYIFLKLATRDAAGNISEHILSRPVAVDGLAPKGKVTGLVP